MQDILGFASEKQVNLFFSRLAPKLASLPVIWHPYGICNVGREKRVAPFVFFRLRGVSEEEGQELECEQGGEDAVDGESDGGIGACGGVDVESGGGAEGV